MNFTDVAHALWVVIGVAGIVIGLWMTRKDLRETMDGEVTRYSWFTMVWGLLWGVLGVLALML